MGVLYILKSYINVRGIVIWVLFIGESVVNIFGGDVIGIGECRLIIGGERVKVVKTILGV